jgi:hypothetical protein
VSDWETAELIGSVVVLVMAAELVALVLALYTGVLP